MKLLPLSKGKFSKVDDAVYDALMSYGWKWYLTNNGYAATTIHYRDGEKWKGTTIFLHRWILESFYNVRLGGLDVDHVNNDKTDNCYENLRPATRAQNMMNAVSKKSGCVSVFKGVTYDKRDRKWYAQIRLQGKHKFLGRFNNEIDAAQAYDQAARHYFGNYARINARPFSELYDFIKKCKEEGSI